MYSECKIETRILQFLLIILFSDFYSDLATIDINGRDRIYKELVVTRTVVKGGKDEG